MCLFQETFNDKSVSAFRPSSLTDHLWGGGVNGIGILSIPHFIIMYFHYIDEKKIISRNVIGKSFSSNSF